MTTRNINRYHQSVSQTLPDNQFAAENEDQKIAEELLARIDSITEMFLAQKTEQAEALEDIKKRQTDIDNQISDLGKEIDDNLNTYEVMIKKCDAINQSYDEMNQNLKAVNRNYDRILEDTKAFLKQQEVISKKNDEEYKEAVAFLEAIDDTYDGIEDLFNETPKIQASQLQTTNDDQKIEGQLREQTEWLKKYKELKQQELAERYRLAMADIEEDRKRFEENQRQINQILNPFTDEEMKLIQEIKQEVEKTGDKSYLEEFRTLDDLRAALASLEKESTELLLAAKGHEAQQIENTEKIATVLKHQVQQLHASSETVAEIIHKVDHLVSEIKNQDQRPNNSPSIVASQNNVRRRQTSQSIEKKPVQRVVEKNLVKKAPILKAILNLFFQIFSQIFPKWTADLKAHTWKSIKTPKIRNMQRIRV